MGSPSQFKELRRQDQKLLKDLERGLSKRTPGRATRERFFDGWLERINSVDELRSLSKVLARGGLFDVRCERHQVKDVDGGRFVMTMARAATTEMWPMGTHYWVRDNALIGARFMASDTAAGRKLGKDLLLSALSFMSSVSQLERFKGIIRARSKTFKADAMNWPYIFAGVKNNLNAAKVEGWAHKQDAWQIVAWYVLKGLEEQQISLRDITEKHRIFLGAVLPFLCSIDFARAENSGSWEEIPAVRTSVRAWEHRLIVKLAQLSRKRGFEFLNREFIKHRRHLGSRIRSLSLTGAVSYLERSVVQCMLKDLPFESPSYPRRDPRYREGDGALIYLLMLDYPQFLATRSKRTQAWTAEVETKILGEVLKLQDDATGGVYRYANDSYQRSGFFRNETVKKLELLYGAPSGDASSHFTGRDKVVPRGRKAAWTHFVWQLAAWAGERYLATDSKRYLELHNRFFKQGLGFVTGARELSIDQDSKGRPRLIPIPRFRMPECFIADTAPSGREVIFPSPHTPLNWSVGEMFNAFRVREVVLGRCVSVSRAARRKAA